MTLLRLTWNNSTKICRSWISWTFDLESGRRRISTSTSLAGSFHACCVFIVISWLEIQISHRIKSALCILRINLDIFLFITNINMKRYEYLYFLIFMQSQSILVNLKRNKCRDRTNWFSINEKNIISSIYFISCCIFTVSIKYIFKERYSAL